MWSKSLDPRSLKRAQRQRLLAKKAEEGKDGVYEGEGWCQRVRMKGEVDLPPLES
jgi:hypothetical protein